MRCIPRSYREPKNAQNASRGSLYTLGLGLFAAWFCVSGCASYPGTGLPVRTYADMVQKFDKKKCVDIAGNIDRWGRPMTIASVYLLIKSGYFQMLEEQCSQAGEEERNSISLYFNSDPQTEDTVLAFVSGMIAGTTLTVIPGYARDTYTLRVKLRKGGKVVKEYVYRDRVVTWIHLAMLPRMSERDRGRAILEVYERMIMNFLYDYSHDIQRHDYFGVSDTSASAKP